MSSLRTLTDLMSQKFPEQEYLVDRIIPEASITILSGTAGSFKTYTLLQLAKCVASGSSLFGQFPTQRSAVLIIDEENGDRLLQKRLRQLETPNDLPIFFTKKPGFRLDPASASMMLMHCQQENVKLVIIDSLIRIHDADENSAREMSKVFEYLRIFTKNGIAVLVTQHHRKQGQHSSGGASEMRGSSDILAAVDAHVGVTRKKLYLTFNQTKQRYAMELEPFQVKVSATENDFTFEYLGMVDSAVDKSETLRGAVVELLGKREQIMQKDLEVELAKMDIQTSEHTLRKSLRLWVTEGLLLVTHGAGNTKLFSLGETARDE